MALVDETGMWALLIEGIPCKPSMSSAESHALDTSGTWKPRILRNPSITKQFESWRRGESEYSGLFKTLQFLIFRDAKNAERGRIAANWNVSGTQDFQFSCQFSEVF